jgi:probable rRNA maturation factor
VKIEVFNTTREKYLPKKKLAKAVRYILVSEGKNFDANIILTGTQKIEKLNRDFRGKDMPTDVLSFVPEESEEPPPFRAIGEIYICLPVARRQAKKAGHSFQSELLFLAAHGALHLCGHTHETDSKYKRMMKRTRIYLERLDC